MNQKSERVNRVDNLEIITLQSNPPTHIVDVEGTATVYASNARLCVLDEPVVPGTLLLELIADHGCATVITRVRASRTFNLNGVMTVVVRGRENEKSIEVPPNTAAEPTAGGGFENQKWRATHFLEAKRADIPVIPGTLLTAFFTGKVNGTVYGSGGCNAYGASFVWMLGAPPSINIYDLHHTDRYCDTPKGIMEQERLFFECLSEAREIERRGDILELRSGPPGTSRGIRFDMAKPAL